MPKKLQKPSKEELRRLYWDERKSTIKLGVKYDCSRVTVSNWMRQYGIPRRAKGMYTKAERLPTKSELVKLYKIDRMTQAEVAERCDVCLTVIRRLLRAHGLVVTGGKCRILEDHVESLKQDSHRLSTKFILNECDKLMCRV